jgi:hypothetical protein
MNAELTRLERNQLASAFRLTNGGHDGHECHRHQERERFHHAESERAIGIGVNAEPRR